MKDLEGREYCEPSIIAQKLPYLHDSNNLKAQVYVLEITEKASFLTRALPVLTEQEVAYLHNLLKKISLKTPFIGQLRSELHNEKSELLDRSDPDYSSDRLILRKLVDHSIPGQ